MITSKQKNNDIILLEKRTFELYQEKVKNDLKNNNYEEFAISTYNLNKENMYLKEYGHSQSLYINNCNYVSIILYAILHFKYEDSVISGLRKNFHVRDLTNYSPKTNINLNDLKILAKNLLYYNLCASNWDKYGNLGGVHMPYSLDAIKIQDDVKWIERKFEQLKNAWFNI